MLTCLAYAKINLTLEVLGRRPDGYHEVMTVLQTIDLKDTLSFQPHPDIRLVCDHPSLESENNLVIKASRLLKAASATREGALIHLQKGIPLAAGLGGGASNAAATLLTLNRLWGLGLSLPSLHHLAAQLGADIPFFLYGGTALARGRGERLTPLPPPPETWAVFLSLPHSIPDKTQRLYLLLEEPHFSRGQATQRLVETLYQGGSVESPLLFNVFQAVADSAFPQLRHHRRLLQEAGAATVHLAGSGPTLFWWGRDRRLAEHIYHRLAHQGLECYLASTKTKEENLGE